MLVDLNCLKIIASTQNIILNYLISIQTDSNAIIFFPIIIITNSLIYFKTLNLNIKHNEFGSDYGSDKFTCQTTVGKIVIDYAIASPSLFPKIADFDIDNFDECLSDVYMWVCISLYIVLV